MNRILVVDDNADILQIVKVILENYGYEVVVTPNGEETLLKTDIFDPHLILMDVFLSSGIDGRDICRALKANDKTKDIPVIMFSAQTKMEDVFSSCRADDFIAKPFEVKDLLNKIQFHLSQQLN
ncbi:MAG: response regulator [Ginsengibacter sp.]